MDIYQPFSGSKQLLLSLLLASLCSDQSGVVAAPNTGLKPGVDYNRDVRPIFAENCYACHGPDQNKRKAGLRLDQKEDAFKELKSGDFAVVPGGLAKSKLIYRMTTSDDDERMPPLNTGKHLTLAQLDLLRRWGAQGPQWEGHWDYT